MQNVQDVEAAGCWRFAHEAWQKDKHEGLRAIGSMSGKALAATAWSLAAMVSEVDWILANTGVTAHFGVLHLLQSQLRCALLACPDSTVFHITAGKDQHGSLSGRLAGDWAPRHGGHGQRAESALAGPPGELLWYRLACCWCMTVRRASGSVLASVRLCACCSCRRWAGHLSAIHGSHNLRTNDRARPSASMMNFSLVCPRPVVKMVCFASGGTCHQTGG